MWLAANVLPATVSSAIILTPSPPPHPHKTPKKQNGITYHNGPVMTNPTAIYIIYYGNSFAGNNRTNIINNFAANVWNTSWYNIQSTYGANTKPFLANFTVITGNPNGTSLSDAAILNIITSKMADGTFPTSTDAVYFLITDAAVTASSGFCTSYCGWHSVATYKATAIKYSFVGDAGRCPTSCSVFSSTVKPPNGDVGMDGAVSVFAHELVETTSDPNLNAWYDSRGNENGDKCAWTFGTTAKIAATVVWPYPGATYNLVVPTPTGNKPYYVQQNWINALFGIVKGKCGMGYPTIPALAFAP